MPLSFFTIFFVCFWQRQKFFEENVFEKLKINIVSPTRLHQQLRKLQELNPGSTIRGRVIEDLGNVSKQTAKGVENTYLNFYYKITGRIPIGNLKSFIPK